MTQLNRISRNNTAIYTAANGTREVFLHKTCIVTVRPDGSVTLRTGGWLTVTTCARMNQVSREWGLGFSVSRAGGVFRVITRNGETLTAPDNRTITFKA